MAVEQPEPAEAPDHTTARIAQLDAAVARAEEAERKMAVLVERLGKVVIGLYDLLAVARGQDSAMEVVQTRPPSMLSWIENAGDSGVERDQLAGQMGVEPRSHAFRDEISALRQAGAITASGGRIRITDMGREVLRPPAQANS